MIIKCWVPGKMLMLEYAMCLACNCGPNLEGSELEEAGPR